MRKKLLFKIQSAIYIEKDNDIEKNTNLLSYTLIKNKKIKQI